MRRRSAYLPVCSIRREVGDLERPRRRSLAMGTSPEGTLSPDPSRQPRDVRRHHARQRHRLPVRAGGEEAVPASHAECLQRPVPQPQALLRERNFFPRFHGDSTHSRKAPPSSSSGPRGDSHPPRVMLNGPSSSASSWPLRSRRIHRGLPRRAGRLRRSSFTVTPPGRTRPATREPTSTPATRKPRLRRQGTDPTPGRSFNSGWWTG